MIDTPLYFTQLRNRFCNHKTKVNPPLIFSQSSASIQDLPAYQEPPKGAKISYAYGIEPSAVKDINQTIHQLCTDLTGKLKLPHKPTIPNLSAKSIQGIYQEFKQLLKILIPEQIESLYKNLPREDIQFADMMINELKNHHIISPLLSMLGINPLTFFILTLVLNAKGTSAEKNYTFVDGPPLGVTPYCDSRPDAYICKEFYMKSTVDNSTLMGGQSELYLTPFQATQPIPKWWECYNTQETKKIYDSIMQNPSIMPKTGTRKFAIHRPDYGKTQISGYQVTEQAFNYINEKVKECEVLKYRSEHLTILGVVCGVIGASCIGLGVIGYFYKRQSDFERAARERLVQAAEAEPLTTVAQPPTESIDVLQEPSVDYLPPVTPLIPNSDNPSDIELSRMEKLSI